MNCMLPKIYSTTYFIIKLNKIALFEHALFEELLYYLQVTTYLCQIIF